MEEIFEFFHKMAPLAQGVGQNWVFYHNFKSNNFFFNLFFFCVRFVLLIRLFYRKKVFEKIKVGGKNLYFSFQQPIMIFSKTFFSTKLAF
jgi:hypothetical protein